MRVDLLNVKKNYGSRTVLDIESLTLEDGKIYSILGPNGSGKSTLLRIISGIDKDYIGSIDYAGSANLSDSISYLPQSPYLFDTSVLGNIILGIKGKANSKSKALNALYGVGMESFINVKARTLSGGEAQKVAVARTLVQGKQLVLLDEPVSSIDIQSMITIENFMKLIYIDNKPTMVFTSHSLSQAIRLADEVLILWEGKIIEMGEAKKVLNTPRRPETREFLKNWSV